MSVSKCITAFLSHSSIEKLRGGVKRDEGFKAKKLWELTVGNLCAGGIDR